MCFWTSLGRWHWISQNIDGTGDHKFTITLEISKENLTKTSDLYVAVAVSKIEESICSPSTFETDLEEVDDTSMLTV